MQEQSKKLVTGKLKEVACQKIDEQTEALVSMIGDNQVEDVYKRQVAILGIALILIGFFKDKFKQENFDL